MPRNAARTGPGMARSPSAHLRTVRSSTSSANAAARCDMPRAAIAALKSAASTAVISNDTLLIHDEASLKQYLGDIGHVLIKGEGIGQLPFGIEQRQALGPIIAMANEAECIGGKGGAGCGLEHESVVGPLGLSVKMFFTQKRASPLRLAQGTTEEESADA